MKVVFKFPLDLCTYPGLKIQLTGATGLGANSCTYRDVLNNVYNIYGLYKYCIYIYINKGRNK